MGRGIFRPLPYRPPRRIQIFAPPTPVTPEAPGLKQRMDLATLTDVNAREPTRIRGTRALAPIGVRTGAQGVVIARLLKERHRRIMFERMARRVVVEQVPVVPTVGQVLSPVRPLAARPVARPAARVPLFVRIARRIVPSSTPTPTRIPIQLPPRAPAARRPPVVPGVPAAPTVGPAPPPARPPAQQPPRVPPVQRPPLVPTARQIVPSSTLPPTRIPSRAPPRAPAVRARALVPGIPAVPTVGFVHLRRSAMPVRAVVYRFRKPPVIMTSVPSAVIVCTSGAWSAVVSFLPCDDYRLELDGPAADQVKASVNMEFEE